MNNPRISAKERNLIKGAIRRVFSRSELRRQAVERSIVPGLKSEQRPRVTKWSQCPRCDDYTPTYLMEVDHHEPIVPVDSQLDAMSWDEVVDRIWCVLSNLIAICKPCHKIKTKQETAERTRNKKRNKK